MSPRLLLLIVAMTYCVMQGQAQGLHFTQYNLSPLTLNPSLTGKYEGTFRIGGIARDQWRAIVGSNAYQTQSLYLDSPVMKGFKRGDWIGVGVMAFNDVVSTGKLKYTAFKISGAYHLALDRKSKNLLSLGAQFGSENRNVNSNYIFQEDVLKGTGTNGTDDIFGTGSSNPDLKAKFSNWTAGASLRSQLSKTTGVEFGLTIANITRPDVKFGEKTLDSKLARRTVFHGKFNNKLNKKWTITPSFLFQTTAKQEEIIIQGLAGYLWDAEKDLTFNMGLSYRLGDAISPMLGAQYKKLVVGFAYDIRTGETLNDYSRGQGAIEIAAYYIQKIYKQPKAKEKIICPRF